MGVLRKMIYMVHNHHRYFINSICSLPFILQYSN